MKLWIPAFCAFALFVLAACQREGGGAAEIINSPGTFRLFGGDMNVTVTENTNGVVNYRNTHGPSTAGPPRSTLRTGRPWFIYAASATNAWIFNGTNELASLEFHAAGTKLVSSLHHPEIIRLAPAQVTQKLPEELKQK